jgi:DnaJ-class molecular chaperone
MAKEQTDVWEEEETISMPQGVPCPSCGGFGLHPTKTFHSCPACEGTGVIAEQERGDEGE